MEQDYVPPRDSAAVPLAMGRQALLGVSDG